MADDLDALTPEEQAILQADRAAEPAPTVEPAAAPAPAEPAADGAAPAPADGAAQPAKDDPAVTNPLVPHKALHEERLLRQAAEQRERDAAKRAELLEERMNLVLRQMQAPQPQQAEGPPPLPDMNQDPVGHLKGDVGLVRHEVEQLKNVLNVLAQSVTGQHQQTEQQRAIQDIAMRSSAMEREYAAQHPDYHEAYEYLVESRKRELIAQGNRPEDVTRFMANEAVGLAQSALQRGMNPAELVHELAKVRGYQPKAANGGANPSAPAIPAQANNPAAAQIAMIARGQQQAAGLNGVPGQSPTPVNAAAIADMSQDEFDAWYNKASKTEKRRVYGG